jgi:hypothetical protein
MELQHESSFIMTHKSSKQTIGYLEEYPFHVSVFVDRFGSHVRGFRQTACSQKRGTSGRKRERLSLFSSLSLWSFSANSALAMRQNTGFGPSYPS